MKANRKPNHTHVTTVVFETLKDLTVLNLSILPNVPSLFDEGQNLFRVPTMFLHDFVNDIAKSIKKDGQEHIEYVPTQIVTEYFRRVYLGGRGVNGIIYPSAASKGRKSYVLFFESKDCVESTEHRKERSDKVLLMKKLSIKNSIL